MYIGTIGPDHHTIIINAIGTRMAAEMILRKQRVPDARSSKPMMERNVNSGRSIRFAWSVKVISNMPGTEPSRTGSGT
jgi:hypothetical protein